MVRDSATLGQDILDQPLAVKPNESVTGVVVTLTDRTGGDRGHHRHRPGSRRLIPDPRLFNRRKTLDAGVTPHVRDTGQAGRRVHHQWRAGRRLSWPHCSIRITAWFNPEFLRQLESA
jgi:hypothetical protein